MDDDIDKDERGGRNADLSLILRLGQRQQQGFVILAQLITIHKSQGSEYDIVVMPLTMANYTGAEEVFGVFVLTLAIRN